MRRPGVACRHGRRSVNYTQVNTNVAAMSDVELEDYRQLLRELKALLPEEAPNRTYRGSG